MDIIADALVTGLPLVPAFMGIYLVFVMRTDFDLTVEASFTMGGAVTAVLLVHEAPVAIAILVGVLCAVLAGVLTTVLYVFLKIPIILAGLIVSIGLYSVNLRILETPSVSLAGLDTAFSRFQEISRDEADLAVIVILTTTLVILLGTLDFFLRTDLGLALRASGINPLMARSHGVDDRFYTGFALILANSLVGFSGAVVVQNQGFADVNMGGGLLLSGVGAVLLGDLLLRPSASNLLRMIVAVVVGTLTYRLVVAVALRVGLASSDLKAVTAVMLVAVFAVRTVVASVRGGRSRRRFNLALRTSGAGGAGGAAVDTEREVSQDA